MNNNSLILWMAENIKRLFAKSPKFFQIWQWVLGLLTALTGLPALLESIRAFHNLPAWVDVLSNKTVAYASLAAFFMAALSTQSKPVAVTKEGEVIKQTNAQALPFTAKHEIKIATKEGNNQMLQ